MSNLRKELYAGMPRNGHQESKTPHCAPVDTTTKCEIKVGIKSFMQKHVISSN